MSAGYTHRATRSAPPRDIGSEPSQYMTIRERFVMAAMQGLLAAQGNNADPPNPIYIRQDAVRYADYVLKEMEQ